MLRLTYLFIYYLFHRHTVPINLVLFIYLYLPMLGSYYYCYYIVSCTKKTLKNVTCLFSSYIVYLFIVLINIFNLLIFLIYYDYNY